MPALAPGFAFVLRIPRSLSLSPPRRVQVPERAGPNRAAASREPDCFLSHRLLRIHGKRAALYTTFLNIVCVPELSLIPRLYFYDPRARASAVFLGQPIHLHTYTHMYSYTHVSISGPFLSSHSLLVTRASDRSCNGDTDAITTTIATTTTPTIATTFLLTSPLLCSHSRTTHYHLITLPLPLHRRRFLHNHYHNLTTRDWLGALIWLRGYQRTRFRFLPCKIVEQIFK